MRFLGCLILLCAALLQTGCSRRNFDGPTVDEFIGRVTHNGTQVSFPEGEAISIKLIHETGQSFGIPIKSDGTFKIGWMPIGKYGATMERPNPGGKGKSLYSVPGGLTIEDGKTEYSIELGKNWKR